MKIYLKSYPNLTPAENDLLDFIIDVLPKKVAKAFIGDVENYDLKDFKVTIEKMMPFISSEHTYPHQILDENKNKIIQGWDADTQAAFKKTFNYKLKLAEDERKRLDDELSAYKEATKLYKKDLKEKIKESITTILDANPNLADDLYNTALVHNVSTDHENDSDNEYNSLVFRTEDENVKNITKGNKKFTESNLNNKKREISSYLLNSYGANEETVNIDKEINTKLKGHPELLVDLKKLIVVKTAVEIANQEDIPTKTIVNEYKNHIKANKTTLRTGESSGFDKFTKALGVFADGLFGGAGFIAAASHAHKTLFEKTRHQEFLGGVSETKKAHKHLHRKR